MMRLSLILIVAVFFCSEVSSIRAQKSIGDLDPAHSHELGRFLSANGKYRFRPETTVDDEYLGSMKATYGRDFRPNYAAGDFNGDGVTDFAVLLAREGKPDHSQFGPDRDDEHGPDFPLVIVVFNGMKKGGFRPAFRHEFFGPRAAFIVSAGERRKQLQYGVYETDSDIVFFEPTRRGGYTLRAPDLP